jgi:hypothetical protein
MVNRELIDETPGEEITVINGYRGRSFDGRRGCLSSNELPKVRPIKEGRSPNIQQYGSFTDRN